MGAIRKMGKCLLILVLLVIVAAAGLIGYLSATEYAPADVETLTVKVGGRNAVPAVGKRITMLSWNIGYGGLGRNQDFFMDGGSMVRPSRKEDVQENLAGIVSTLSQQQADVYLLQELDLNAQRSYFVNERSEVERGLMMGSAFAYNYKCDFVPFPWPMIGKVESGLLTMSAFQVKEATRESLPVPFSWPMRVANLKRCLLVERLPVEGSEKEVVIVNLHLEAYDDGAGKRAQTQQLMALLQAEYRKGNYVIAGGDFNQIFPHVTQYPVLNDEYWAPGQLSADDLPQGFSYAFDASTPTCRLLNEPYSGDRAKTQLYVIDGFIVSSNVKVNHVQTIDLNFRNSDHQPVRLEFTLNETENP